MSFQDSGAQYVYQLEKIHSVEIISDRRLSGDVEDIRITVTSKYKT